MLPAECGQVELWPAVTPTEVVLRDIGDRPFVARGKQREIYLLRAAVANRTCLPRRPRPLPSPRRRRVEGDAAAGCSAVGGTRRACDPLGHPNRVRSPLDHSQQRGEEGALDTQGKGRPGLGEHVGRDAEEMLGDHVAKPAEPRSTTTSSTASTPPKPLDTDHTHNADVRTHRLDLISRRASPPSPPTIGSPRGP